MTAKWEKLEGNSGVLTVEVESERFDSALDEAFKKVVKDVSIPGFRKGRVPRKIFEQRFGVEALYEDALDIILPGAYSDAVEETGIEPVDQPEIDIEQIEKGKNLIFKAKVTVKPEVKLGQYKGLEVEDINTEVTDEDVENELKALQERNADLVAIEDGEVQKGDMAIIDFEGFVDGEAFDGGKAENYSLEIGSGQFIPGFEDQLIGVKTGEEVEVNVEFPDDYHAEDLAGKPATFKVKVHEIKRKELPELDDEFAIDVDDEVETLDELKEKIKERLINTREQDAENRKKDILVEQAIENAEIDVPDVMINNETDRMIRELEQQLQSQGMNLDLYYQFTQTDEDSLREQFRTDAEKRVRMNLTLEAIAKEENIEVTEDEIKEEIEKMAEMFQRSTEEIEQILALQGGRVNVEYDIKIRKAVDLLLAEAKLVEAKEEETEEEKEEQ